MKHILIKFYLDYINDWLTVEAYASYNGLPMDVTLDLINLGRSIAWACEALKYANDLGYR